MTNLKLKRILLLLMSVLLCTTASWAINTTYRIVNNKGEVCFMVKGTTNKPELPSRARTPYATNYRYYLTLQEAQRDARYGAELAASTYGAQPLNTNVNLSGDGDVYVRYDYTSSSTITDAEGNVVRIDGKVAYNLQVNDRLVYYSTATSPEFTTPKSSNNSVVGPVAPSADEPIRITHSMSKIYNGTDDNETNNLTDAVKGTAPYKWVYDGTQSATNNYEASLGHPDPYDLRLINLSDRTKVLTGIQNNSFPFTPSAQQYIHLTLAADGASATYVQRFFIRKINAIMQVAACEPMYVYLSGSGNSPLNMCFVLNKEKDEPQWMGNFNNEKYHVASLHLRLHEKQDATGITASSSANRSTCTFHALKNRKYTIVGRDGTTRASAYAPVSETETLEVPSEINSPLVSSYTYHKNANDAKNGSNSYLNISDFETGEDVFVGYSYNSANTILKLDDATARYSMLLNGNYLKYQEGAGDDSDVTVGAEGESENTEYRWKFSGSDPYGILVSNDAASSKNITGVSTSGTITLGTDSKAAALQGNTSASSRTPYRYYLVKSPNWTDENPRYILRAASVGSEDLKYNWGYVGEDQSDWNESQPRLAASTWLSDDNEAVQLQLEELRTTPLTYHIVDLNHTEVTSAETRFKKLAVPNSIKSPLVSAYHYYGSLTDAQADDRSEEISSTDDKDDIFVTYDVDDEIYLNVNVGDTIQNNPGKSEIIDPSKHSFYMLKFLNPNSYIQEDGNNGLTEEESKAEIPYANGDACMNIYSQDFANKTLNKGASARTRIPWGLMGGDPYRVKIVSYQNSHNKITGNDFAWYFTYFRTYYNTDTKKVITTNVTDDPKVTTHAQFGNANAVPSEYMILGSKGKYKLVTTEKINDGTTTEHRTLHSFEQYWKNYETIGTLLGDYDPTSKVVVAMPSDAELTARGWSKYPAWANAKPLDGGSKSYEYQNHWFQTFEVGEEFDLIPISLKPSIVLLDKHGWEVFRYAMPDAKAHTKNDGTDNNANDNYIRTYNSPAVKAYHWYKKATKLSGYHKYKVSDPAMKTEEEEFTSTDLTVYPDNYATNPGDWYVTYEVKDEYKYLYDNASGHAAPVLIKQGGKFAKAASATAIGSADGVTVTGSDDNLTITGDITNDMLWYLKRNTSIDEEMGYLYAGESGAQSEAKSKADTEEEYTEDNQGFDPYNVQIKNASNAKFFKTQAKTIAINSGGSIFATYNDRTLVLGDSIRDAGVTSAVSYDNVAYKSTNATFMILRDSVNNLRLVPRLDQLSAVTNLTGSAKVNTWVYDLQKTDSVAMQTITLQPIQRYKFYVREANSSDIIAQSAAAFYARPGAALASGTIGKATGIPLPDDLIRSYCDYQGAYTTYDATNNTYDNKVTCYPPGAGTGIAETPIYVPYSVDASLFSTAETPSWYNMSFVNKNSFHMMNTSTSKLQSGGLQAADESKWMLIGNPYQFKLVNKAKTDAGYYLRIRETNVTKANNSGLVTTTIKPEVSNTAGNNDWTLVYMVDAQGNVHEQLRTYDNNYTLDGSGTYYLYVKTLGELLYDNRSVENNYTSADVFLSNLITVTYHVFQQPATGGTWSSTAEYEESIDYEPNQLADQSELPSSVYRPLCQYTFYKDSADMKNTEVNGYENFSALYTSMSDAEKAVNFDVYLSYVVNAAGIPVGDNQPVKFFATEAEATASMEWSFLMQGLESAAKIYGKKLVDYGKARAYGTDDRGDWGEDVAGLTEAEKSFVQYTGYTKIGGFHFLHHNTSPTVDAQTGSMTVPDGISEVGMHKGTRYIHSQNTELDVCLMSPLNDFRRIAETYKDGSETSPRTDSWLWAFIGTPYKFEIINREALAGRVYDVNGDVTTAGTTHKRLAIIKSGTTLKDNAVKLVADYTAQTDGEDNYPHYWTLAQLAPETMPDGTQDPETPVSFAIKVYGEDLILSHTSGSSLDFRVIATPAETDISYLKSTGFMAHPWNWSNTKYKTVTVNIYKDAVSGTPVLTKTYTPADRAFIAGDVIDGTDGHFYLPVEALADGSWKPLGVFTNTVPYDKHLINIPYELRRRFCEYSVANGNTNVNGTNDGFTIQDTDDEQIINLVYTIPASPKAPRFVSESELASFRSKAETATFNGATKKEYFYFLDFGNDLSNHAYVENGGYYPAKASNSRYDANDPSQLMYYFVGDPYQLRICNAYTDKVGAYNNLARNVWPNGTNGAYGNDAANDNKTYMAPESDSRGMFYWEMVDAQATGTYGYNAASANVNYRIDFLKDKTFALRTKNKNTDKATYYYLGKGSTTSGSYIYKDGDQSVNISLNVQEAFRTFPDVRHAANVATNTTLTAMRPATVYVSVYDQDEPTRFVTKNELSEYYAQSERFTGVPANLQRNYCNYTWASTNSDTKSANMLDGGYFTVNDKVITMYAKYVETDDSPFSRLNADSVPVLKRDANLSPWYNMSVGNRWAFFNSNLDGMTSPLYSYNSSAKTWNNLRPNTGGKPNNSVLSFPYTGAISTVNDRFHKGMHWALVGDPYNFQIRCQRDIITFETIQGSLGQDSIVAKLVNGDYEYTPAYINGTAMDTQANGTWWTWMRNRNTTNYFLSESPTRRTAVTATTASARANAPRRLPKGYPSDPSANPAENTLNLKAPGESGTIESGNNYGLGDVMRLVSVDDVDANNEAFDAVVIVYNKVNEPVATTGWTELIRKNVQGNGEIPGDVRRWGCTYHYWADETMTLYPFTSFNQTDDSGNYLIKDGGIVYVTYDYDESLYSSENEYRWVNLFFNWDDITKQWNKELDNNAVKYKAEYCEYNTTTKTIVPNRHTYEVKVNSYETDDEKKAYKYTEQELHRETQVGWISSPENYNQTGTESTGTFATQNAWANETSRSESVDQKWAMIGDPYRFILYNYQRKRESGSENAYYLYYDGTTIQNKNFTGADAFNDTDNIKATKQGIYWTWKVDGTRYQFARNDNNTTQYYIREEVPTSYYDAENKLETGYLGICDMTTTSIYDVNNLLGAVKGYASFNHPRLRDVEDTSVSSSYTKGYKEKYRLYEDDTNFTDDKSVDYTTWAVVGDDIKAEALACWQKTYGTDKGYTLGTGDQANVIQSGDYQGYYIGPTLEKEETVTVNSKKQEWEPAATMEANRKYLTATGGASVKPGGSTIPSLVLGDAERFLVVPMTAQAASVTFHLDTLNYANGTPIAGKTKRNFKNNPVFDHTTRNFGVDNTIIMPWMMRRQYCDYKFYVVKDSEGRTPDNANYSKEAPISYSDAVDSLIYNPNNWSNDHSIATRNATYDTFWSNVVEQDLKTSINANNDLEVTIPESWKNKHIYLLVRYQPTAEFTAMQSTNTGGTDEAKAATIHWVSIQNQEKGNLMRYTRSNDVTGEKTDQGEHTTNDYLWAIEGDPYGFVLHNRYAEHGFDGTVNADWSDQVLKTPKVNSTEKFNYVSGASDGNPNFTYDASGNPVKKSNITYGAKGTADGYGTMSTAANKEHSIYEAMIGNYDEAMMIHPIDGCINIRNQNGYKYFGAFLFNGAPTDFPVQLNYMQEWEAMRNVYCNWQLVKPTAAQILPYYNRAGYVGGLKADVASDNAELFGKVSGGTATAEELATATALVTNPANIVQFTNGYYRLRAYSADNGIVGGQYVSGYLHKRELEQEGGTPLHLFDKAGTSGTYKNLANYDGNDWMADVTNNNLLEVMDAEFDPSSVLYITRDANGYMKMQTQGLVVSDNILKADEDAAENSKLFQMQDIGQTAFQIRTKASVEAATPVENAYLSYDPTKMKYGINDTTDELNISNGIVDGETIYTHDTKWLLEPVGATATNEAGVTYSRPLKVKVSALADGNSYTVFCAPFAYTLPDAVTAQTGSVTGEAKDTPYGKYFYGKFAITELEKGEVVPAGQPVIFKVQSADAPSGYIELSLNASAPQADIVADDLIKGTYLTLDDIDVPQGKKVYILGGKSGKPVFRQNAQKDYNNQSNNQCLPHNKMYLLLTLEEADALSRGQSIDFSYVLEEENIATGIESSSSSARSGDDTIYDLQGRKVERITQPGVYIRNGKKFVVRRGQY